MAQPQAQGKVRRGRSEETLREGGETGVNHHHLSVVPKPSILALQAAQSHIEACILPKGATHIISELISAKHDWSGYSLLTEISKFFLFRVLFSFLLSFLFHPEFNFYLSYSIFNSVHWSRYKFNWRTARRFWRKEAYRCRATNRRSEGERSRRPVIRFACVIFI